MNKAYIKFFGVEILCLIIQLCFSKLNLFGFLSPIGLTFAFARLATGANILIVCAVYFISKIYSFVAFQSFMIVLYEIVFLALFYFAIGIFKIKREWTVATIFLFFSNILSLYFSLENYEMLWHFALNLCLEILIFFYLYKFFKVYHSKFIFFRFSHRDYLIFSVMTLFLSMGIFSFNFIWIGAKFFVLIFPAILLCRILPADKYFATTSLLSIGAFVVTGDLLTLAITLVVALLLTEFREFNKYIYGIISAVVLTIFMLIFKIYDIFSIISISFAIFLFLIIPNRWILKMSSLFETEQTNVILKSLDEQKIEGIKSRLMLMSDTFANMQKDFKFLLVGKINRQIASRELAADVIKKCCSTCENYKACFHENINKRMLFENLLAKAIDSGRIEQNDLLSGIEAYCTKSSIAISEINQTAKMFLDYESTVKSEDSSKLLIASELENFAEIFLNFSRLMKPKLLTNDRLSKILKEKLVSGMIDAKEVVIVESEKGIESVSVILPNEQISKKEVLEITSRVTKIKMSAEPARHLEFSGLSLATFSPASKLKVSFAVSSKAKEKANGDSTAITRLAKNKYFVAISDGMGHGENANKISTMVLSLIKSMFEVGLDSDLILQSINRLLLPAGLDSFTTLDALVIDLELSECHFIKLGSSVSVIKRANTSEVVASDSLPMGIVQNLKPTIVKKQISAGDMIFLASDGVVDTFSDVSAFKSFINDSKIYNMQKYIDDVIFDARISNPNHLDDMTIIGINLLKN